MKSSKRIICKLCRRTCWSFNDVCHSCWAEKAFQLSIEDQLAAEPSSDGVVQKS